MIHSIRTGIKLSALAPLLLLLMPSFTLAHHGWAGYNADVDSRFTVTELRLGNAHDHLTAIDGDGKEWDLVLATPTRNRRLGFDEETLAVGDQIDLLGRLHPSKAEIKVHCIYMEEEVMYTYYDFDGTTSLSKHSDRDQC